MAAEVFIDASGFYALRVRSDDRHDRARSVMKEMRLRETLSKDAHFRDAGFTLLRA